MLGHEPPDPERARKFPYQFHYGQKIGKRKIRMAYRSGEYVAEVSPLRRRLIP